MRKNLTRTADPLRDAAQQLLHIEIFCERRCTIAVFNGTTQFVDVRLAGIHQGKEAGHGILANQCLCVGGLLRFRKPGERHTAVRKDVIQASHAAICIAGRNRDLSDVFTHKGHFTGKVVHDGTKGSTSL